MSYSGQVFGASYPYQFKIPSATETQDGVMTKQQVIRLDSLTPGDDILRSVQTDHVLFVRYGTIVENPTGSPVLPFATLAEAAAFAGSQPPAAWQIILGPGQEPGSVTIPPARLFILVGSGPITVLGDLRLSTAGGAFSGVGIQSMNVGVVHCSDDGIPGGAVLVIGQNCNFSGCDVAPGTQSAIATDLSGIRNAPFDDFIPCRISGDWDLSNAPPGGSFIFATNVRFMGSVNGAQCTYTSCLFDAPGIFSDGLSKGIGFAQCRWNAQNPVITFTVGAGTAQFDVVSAIGFGLSGGQIVNGEPINDGIGARLVRVDVGFNAAQAAKASAPGRVTPATGNTQANSDATIGVIFPNQGSAGALGLLWPTGSSPDNVNLPLGTYYRSSTGNPVLFGSIPPGDNTGILGNSDGQVFYVQTSRGFTA